MVADGNGGGGGRKDDERAQGGDSDGIGKKEVTCLHGCWARTTAKTRGSIFEGLLNCSSIYILQQRFPHRSHPPTETNISKEGY